MSDPFFEGHAPESQSERENEKVKKNREIVTRNFILKILKNSLFERLRRAIFLLKLF
jgi:hypothetical protein